MMTSLLTGHTLKSPPNASTKHTFLTGLYAEWIKNPLAPSPELSFKARALVSLLKPNAHAKSHLISDALFNLNM